MTRLYEVTKLLCPNKKGDYNNYSIFIKLDNKIKASGYIHVDIMEGGLIEDVFVNKNDNTRLSNR